MRDHFSNPRERHGVARLRATTRVVALVFALMAAPYASSQSVPVLVADINTSGDSSPAELTAIGTTVFFRATDTAFDTELWKSDGTEAGTVRVKDINTAGSSFPLNLAGVGGTLFFSTTDSTNDIELWKSDGTQAGTVRVADINPSGSSLPVEFTDVAGTLFFTAVGAQVGRELWILGTPGPK